MTIERLTVFWSDTKLVDHCNLPGSAAVLQLKKTKFQNHISAAEQQDFFVREAKRAIEISTDEFSTPDAVIQQPRSEGA